MARDRNTLELSLAIREALHRRIGAYPHLVLSNLHRTKLDPNREVQEGARGDPHAERAWWEFQIFAEEAGNLVEETSGAGLHLDIHGHAHEIDRLELGYLLSGSDLAHPDPGTADYFGGGYNTGRHGARSGRSISAIQIEHHFPGPGTRRRSVRDTRRRWWMP